jgi:hypothetical protein
MYGLMPDQVSPRHPPEGSVLKKGLIGNGEFRDDDDLQELRAWNVPQWRMWILWMAYRLDAGSAALGWVVNICTRTAA